jgi:uncharacterized protein
MGWINMSDAERRAIMVDVPARLETITRRPRKITRRQEIEALRQQRTARS